MTSIEWIITTWTSFYVLDDMEWELPMRDDYEEDFIEGWEPNESGFSIHPVGASDDSRAIN